jgi:hypothetical protein
MTGCGKRERYGFEKAQTESSGIRLILARIGDSIPGKSYT